MTAYLDNNTFSNSISKAAFFYNCLFLVTDEFSCNQAAFLMTAFLVTNEFSIS